MPLLLAILAGLLSLLTLRSALDARRRRRLLAHLPTSRTRGVFLGLVEVEGKAYSRSPLCSHLAEVACVHYRYTVEEEWERQVIRTVADGRGGTRTETRTESGWSQVASGGEQIPFFVVDEEGELEVRPDGARVLPRRIFSRTVGRASALYYEKGPRRAVSHSTGRRRFAEDAIAVGDPVFVVGRAQLREDAVAAEIAAHPEAEMFWISTRGERRLGRRFAFAAGGWLLLSAALAAASAAGLDWFAGGDWRSGEPLVREPKLWLAAGLSWCFAWIGGECLSFYNGLVDLHHRVQRAFAEIEVQLERRRALIPALCQAVSAWAREEREVQTLLADLRSQLQTSGAQRGEPKAMAGRLLAVGEAHPELTSHRGFADLQRALIDAEQRIALARDYFLEIATRQRDRWHQVPDRWVARWIAPEPLALGFALDFERAPPQVRLAEVPEPPPNPGASDRGE